MTLVFFFLLVNEAKKTWQIQRGLSHISKTSQFMKNPWDDIHVLNSRARHLKFSDILKLSIFLRQRLSHTDNDLAVAWGHVWNPRSHFLLACQMKSSHKHAALKFRHVCVGQEVFLDIMTFCKHWAGLIWVLAWTWLLSCCQFCWRGVGLPPKTHESLAGQKADMDGPICQTKSLPRVHTSRIGASERIILTSHISSSLITDHTGGCPLKSFELNLGCTMALLSWGIWV